MLEDDTVAVSGLSVMLDDEVTPPYLELTLRCRGKHYRAAVLAAEHEWGLTLKDEEGRRLSTDGDFYATQEGALLAALLIVLHSARRST